MMTQTLSLLVILLLTVEWKECTTAAVQGNTHYITGYFKTLPATGDTSRDKSCVSSTNDTTKTHLIFK